MSSSSQNHDPLVLKADKLALSFRRFANVYKHIERDNSFWQYRPYQGGDPATLIDWKLSARAEKLYVREKKDGERKSVYLWCDTSTPALAEEGRILLLALTRLLLQDFFKVFWVSVNAQGALRSMPACTSEAEFDSFAAQSLLPFSATAKFPPMFKIARASGLVFCSDFQADPEKWRQIFLQTADENPCGILLHLGGSGGLPSAESSFSLSRVKDLAARSGWHVVSHISGRTLAPETLSTLMTFLSEQR